MEVAESGGRDRDKRLNNGRKTNENKMKEGGREGERERERERERRVNKCK